MKEPTFKSKTESKHPFRTTEQLLSFGIKLVPVNVNEQRRIKRQTCKELGISGKTFKRMEKESKRRNKAMSTDSTQN